MTRFAAVQCAHRHTHTLRSAQTMCPPATVWCVQVLKALRMVTSCREGAMELSVNKEVATLMKCLRCGGGGRVRVRLGVPTLSFPRSEAYEWMADAQQLVVSVIHATASAGDPTVAATLVQQKAPIALMEVARASTRLSGAFRLAALRCVLMLYKKKPLLVTEQLDGTFGMGALPTTLLSMLQEPAVVVRRHASALLAAFSCVSSASVVRPCGTSPLPRPPC